MRRWLPSFRVVAICESDSDWWEDDAFGRELIIEWRGQIVQIGWLTRRWAGGRDGD